MRSAALAAFLLGMLVASGARAETWIEVDPDTTRLAARWKEGRVTSLREGGRSFVRIETDGRGAPSLAATAARSGTALDARGRFVKLLVRVHGLERLAGLEVRLGSDGLATSWYALAPSLYADPEFNLLQDGEWTSLTLSFGGAVVTGTPRREAIDSAGVVVRDRGDGAVAIDVGGIALVEHPPEGVASLTFDDAWAEHLPAARHIAARGWRGTVYVIPSVIGQPGRLGRASLTELGKLGFDVSAHEDVPFTQLPADRLVATLGAVQRYLAAAGFAAASRHLAYPLGKQEPRRVRPAVRARFATARIAGGGPETLPPGDPHLIRAVNVHDAMRPEEVGALARRARANGEWLVLMLHRLVETPRGPTEYALADFERLLGELAASGIRVEPVSEVWRRIGPPGS